MKDKGWDYNRNMSGAPVTVVAVVEGGRHKEIEKKCRRAHSVWEIDFLRGPFFAEPNDPRPYLTAWALVCDSESGDIIAEHLQPLSGWRQLVSDQLYTAMENTGAIPERLFVRSERIAAAVDAICHHLKINLVITPELDAIDQAKNSLQKPLRG